MICIRVQMLLYDADVIEMVLRHIRPCDMPLSHGNDRLPMLWNYYVANAIN